MAEEATGTRVRVTRIGQETHYVAEVPSRLMGDHSALFSDDEGRIWGQIGSDRNPPEDIASLPAWSDRRIAAMRAWHDQQYQSAYDAILVRHPDAANGVRTGGTIVLTDRER